MKFVSFRFLSGSGIHGMAPNVQNFLRSLNNTFMVFRLTSQRHKLVCNSLLARGMRDIYYI